MLENLRNLTLDELEEIGRVNGIRELKEYFRTLEEEVTILKENLEESSITFIYKNRKFYSSYYTTLESNLKNYFILEDLEEEIEVIESLDSKYFLDLLENREV